MTKRIEDYALIGDCESAALVARDGSIDWLCWPRFDSGALFAALLGTPENGHWSMSAVEGTATRRRYRDNTLILETDFETESGAVTLIDFMPFHREGPSRLIRLVQGRSGEVEMATELHVALRLRPDCPLDHPHGQSMGCRRPPDRTWLFCIRMRA